MPAWWSESFKQAQATPLSLNRLAGANKDAWTKCPFALHIEAGQPIQVCLPSTEPKDKESKIIFGYLMGLIEESNMIPVISTATSEDEAWNSFAAVSENIKGAAACLTRTDIAPQDNIPKNFTVGWNYALWYAFVSVSKEPADNQFVSIARTTNFISGSKANAWSLGQFPTLGRIASLIRTIAMNLTAKVVGPKKFLKKEGFFIDKLVGKKPVPGLYTTTEFDKIKNDWSTRKTQVIAAYAAIPDKFDAQVDKPLGAIMKTFAGIRKTDGVKLIEDAKDKRTPMLLIPIGRGRDKKMTLAKGNTLSEKVISVAPENPRAVGKIMWSPETGITQSEFIDASMGIVETVWVTAGVTSALATRQWLAHLENTGKPQVAQQLRQFNTELAECVSTYLEILPMSSDIPSWSSFFGTRA
jgi:hypothetical protein